MITVILVIILRCVYSIEMNKDKRDTSSVTGFALLAIPVKYNERNQAHNVPSVNWKIVRTGLEVCLMCVTSLERPLMSFPWISDKTLRLSSYQFLIYIVLNSLICRVALIFFWNLTSPWKMTICPWRNNFKIWMNPAKTPVDICTGCVKKPQLFISINSQTEHVFGGPTITSFSAAYTRLESGSFASWVRC